MNDLARDFSGMKIYNNRVRGVGESGGDVDTRLSVMIISPALPYGDKKK